MVKAKAAVANSLKYKRQRKNLPSPADTADEDAADKAADKDLKTELDRILAKGFDPACYPKEWLCFVLQGKPSDKPLKSYNSGLAGR